MRVKLLASLGALALASSAALAGQKLVDPVNGGLENTDWVEDINFDNYSGSGPIQSNRVYEYFGATPWYLYGWNAQGHGSEYYTNGQYGPTKDPRDFTASAFGGGAPHQPGLIPGFKTGQWIIGQGGPINRTTRPDNSADHILQSTGWTQPAFFIAGGAKAGDRVKLSIDYANQGNNTNTFELAVIGMKDNNLARKPYGYWDFGPDNPWSAPDVTNLGTNLANTVQPGPDMVWGGDGTTGQTFPTTLVGGHMAATVADPNTGKPQWANYSKSFFVPQVDAERGGDSFDHLAVRWNVMASGEQTELKAIDNLKMQIIDQGDADEDGDVDGDDVAKWAVNFTGALTNPTTPKTWAEGDWDNDGDVDGDDVAKWAVNFTGALSGGFTVNAPGASPQAIALLEQMGINVVVPEPASLGLLAFGALAMLRRRKA